MIWEAERQFGLQCKQESAASVGKRRSRGGRDGLNRDLVRPDAVVVPGRFSLHPHRPKDAHEAPDRVGLPGSCFHDLGQRCTFAAS